MLVSTKAIVLHSIRYREADLIVKCYTQSSGLKSYLLRGVLKSKKGKLRASMFQPLTQLEIEAIHKDKNTLENIKEAKVAHPYISIPTNIYKSSVTMFLAEVLYQAIQEEEENKELFQFLQTSMLWLDQNSTFANFHLLFLVKLTRFLGFQPHLGNKEYCFFNLLDGEFQVEDTNKYCIYNENSILLKQLLNSGFDQLSLLKLNQNRRKSFVEMLVYYYELHLHGFRKPKSLEVLQQLF